jgi:hypothetical protein
MTEEDQIACFTVCIVNRREDRGRKESKADAKAHFSNDTQ